MAGDSAALQRSDHAASASIASMVGVDGRGVSAASTSIFVSQHCTALRCGSGGYVPRSGGEMITEKGKPHI